MKFILLLFLFLISLIDGFRFLQITDIHIDPYYDVGSPVLTACHCHPSNTSSEICAGNQTLLAKKYGTRGWDCDSPPLLVYDWLNTSSQQFLLTTDFIVWTGDTARHNRDPNFLPVTFKDVIRAIKNMTYYFTEIWYNLKRLLPIYPSLGNNDVFPHDTCTQGPNVLFGNISESWNIFLQPLQLKEFELGGYYKKKYNGYMDIISLNTIYFANFNDAVPDCNISGASQNHMNWLNSTLHESLISNKFIYLTGHVPPHPQSYKSACFQKYIEISYQYQNIIKAHLFGHTHADQFWLLKHPKVNNNLVVGVVNVAPSVTPSYNPSIRMFNYNPNTGTLSDIWQYYTNISEDNSKNESPTTLKLEYRMTEAYNMKDLSLQSWIKLSDQIANNETVRKLYKKYETVSSGNPLAKFIPYLRDLHGEDIYI